MQTEIPFELRQIRPGDYEYELPEDRIALYPLTNRDESKLLYYHDGQIKDYTFHQLPELIAPGSTMVFNNTKVIQARLIFRKSTGAQIEVFCLEPSFPSDYAVSLSQRESCVWKCLVGNARKWKNDKLTAQLETKGQKVCLKAEIIGRAGEEFNISFSWDHANLCFSDILEIAGLVPLPPYIRREVEKNDQERYQTIYAKNDGSVAAPTAGLHFTDELLSHLDAKGILRLPVSLHVGAGTFKPVQSDTIETHVMHTEHFEISRSALEGLYKNPDFIIPVGTTSLRSLESLYHLGIKIFREKGNRAIDFHIEQWDGVKNKEHFTFKDSLESLIEWLDRNSLDSLKASTQLMIIPGYKIRSADGLVTNFHMPRSTLLMLVASITDNHWRKIYSYALENGYRFLSYGDGSLLINQREAKEFRMSFNYS